MMLKTNVLTRAITGFCIATSILGIFYFLPSWIFSIVLLLLCIGVSHEWYKLAPHHTILQWIVYPLTPFALLIICNQTSEFRYLVGLLLLLVFVHDTSAYVIGSLCGTHKLAPSISPGKTWEGFIGGLIGLLITLHSIKLYDITISFVTSLLTALAITTLATTGDLYVSWYKRKRGVKDTGTLLPGHGGLLDRCDSLLFCAYGLGIYLLMQYFF